MHWHTFTVTGGQQVGRVLARIYSSACGGLGIPMMPLLLSSTCQAPAAWRPPFLACLASVPYPTPFLKGDAAQSMGPQEEEWCL